MLYEQLAKFSVLVRRSRQDDTRCRSHHSYDRELDNILDDPEVGLYGEILCRLRIGLGDISADSFASIERHETDVILRARRWRCPNRAHRYEWDYVVLRRLETTLAQAVARLDELKIIISVIKVD